MPLTCPEVVVPPDEAVMPFTFLGGRCAVYLSELKAVVPLEAIGLFTCPEAVGPLEAIVPFTCLEAVVSLLRGA